MPDIATEMYRLWLGVPADEPSPSHYRLLGLAESEPDAAVIEFVAGWRIEFVAGKLKEPDAEPAKALLARMKAARRTLLRTDEKSKYDAQLRREHSHWKAPPPCSIDDAARRWLGVVTPRYQVPPDHLLVGIPPGESDPAVLRSQFDQRLSMLNQLEQNTTDDEQRLVAELIALLAKAERRLTKQLDGSNLTPRTQQATIADADDGIIGGSGKRNAESAMKPSNTSNPLQFDVTRHSRESARSSKHSALSLSRTTLISIVVGLGLVAVAAIVSMRPTERPAPRIAEQDESQPPPIPESTGLANPNPSEVDKTPPPPFVPKEEKPETAQIQPEKNDPPKSEVNSTPQDAKTPSPPDPPINNVVAPIAPTVPPVVETEDSKQQSSTRRELDLAIAAFNREMDRARNGYSQSFDKAIESLRKTAKVQGEEKFRLIAELEADQKVFKTEGYVTMAHTMRAATFHYFSEMSKAQRELGKAYTRKIDSCLKKHLDAEADVFRTEKTLIPKVIWKFAGGQPLRSDGTTNRNGTWILNESALVIRYPDNGAPGGAWIDTCVFNADGSKCDMRNNGRPPKIWSGNRGTR